MTSLEEQGPDSIDPLLSLETEIAGLRSQISEMQSALMSMATTGAANANPATILPMPLSISEAMDKVASGVKSVARSDTNTFGNYKYASADAIYAAIGPLLADAGLKIIPIELEPTSFIRVDTAKGPKQWGKFHIGFVYVVGSDQWFDPRNSETLFIQIEGPQTFQGAKSYAQKTHHRQVFKIPTGEADLDGLDNSSGDSDGDGAPPSSSKKSTKTKKATEKFDVLDSHAKRAAILNDLSAQFKAEGSKGLSPLVQSLFAEKWGAEIDRLQPDDAEAVRNEFKKLRAK